MNEHEQAARTRKVLVLIAALRERLPATSTVDLAKAIPLIERPLWDDIADLAGVRSPSATTIEWIATTLKNQAKEDLLIEAARRRRPGIVHKDDNMFAGLT